MLRLSKILYEYFNIKSIFPCTEFHSELVYVIFRKNQILQLFSNYNAIIHNKSLGDRVVMKLVHSAHELCMNKSTAGGFSSGDVKG